MLCFVCVTSDMTSEDQDKTDRIQQLEKRIEELENKQQLSKFSRRGLLAGVAGVAGLGAMSGSGAAASGQVGTANNRVDVFADTVDTNNLTGVSTGGGIFTQAQGNPFTANSATSLSIDLSALSGNLSESRPIEVIGKYRPASEPGDGDLTLSASSGIEDVTNYDRTSDSTPFVIVDSMDLADRAYGFHLRFGEQSFDRFCVHSLQTIRQPPRLAQIDEFANLGVNLSPLPTITVNAPTSGDFTAFVRSITR